ncbi:MAG: YebC/PmpR family DNA-binding transcriptional regulator [Bdellovibrionaceae bacterium]|nr:YebC/PmpR family DNA-binding transcriptional regulator [Pseudobdellovibrionaceae bacterium]
MAGHNKWSKVKHIKGAADAKKGKVFTKLVKELMVAARTGGGDPDANARLRAAIVAAKAASMPKDNIERAIKKGTGEVQDGTSIEEAAYEAYAPGGVAVIVEAATDNKNRTVADLRNLFKNNGGNLAETGSVAWMFQQCGLLVFDASKYSEDKVMEVALEAGAQDVNSADGGIEVTTDTTEIYKVKEVFDNVGMHPESAELSFVPKNKVKVEDKDTAQKLLKLLELVEDHEDVQKIHANFEMDDALFAEVAGE